MQVTDATRDELPVLGAKVENDDLLLACLHGPLQIVVACRDGSVPPLYSLLNHTTSHVARVNMA